MSKSLVLGAATFVFLAAGASAADLVAPGYGYASPVYVAPACVYTAPPVYVAPVYTAPPVYAAPQVYTAPPVTTGYYEQIPVVLCGRFASKHQTRVTSVSSVR